MFSVFFCHRSDLRTGLEVPKPEVTRVTRRVPEARSSWGGSSRCQEMSRQDQDLRTRPQQLYRSSFYLFDRGSSGQKPSLGSFHSCSVGLLVYLLVKTPQQSRDSSTGRVLLFFLLGLLGLLNCTVHSSRTPPLFLRRRRRTVRAGRLDVARGGARALDRAR